MTGVQDVSKGLVVSCKINYVYLECRLLENVKLRFISNVVICHLEMPAMVSDSDSIYSAVECSGLSSSWDQMLVFLGTDQTTSENGRLDLIAKNAFARHLQHVQ